MADDTFEIKIDELVNWTDEECAEFDEKRHIAVATVRELAKELIGLSNTCKTLREQYQVLYNENYSLKSVLLDGRVLGYAITCPECKVNYNIKPDELNYNEEITCQDCGAKYIQNKNIVGLYLREDNTNAAQE